MSIAKRSLAWNPGTKKQSSRQENLDLTVFDKLFRLDSTK
ncbi:hypothetical protein CCACVL1_26589 [Corchorus capsularis]|uniref:Uncharacterized protein n=1 Tax=Corchorus capsularis TaxID=210143 RepID=A0A1R3GE28_COCAP|nr:hypothetical protein CCACVL1_26589 [Corchorus capsularis]